MKIDFTATFAGKHIHVIQNSGPEKSVSDLRKFMRTFSIHSTLLILGRAYAGLENRIDDPDFNGIQSVKHGLPYLAMLAMENCRLRSGQTFNAAALKRAFELYSSLREPVLDELAPIENLTLDQSVETLENFQTRIKRLKEGAIESHMLRQGLHSFHHQGELRHILPRTDLLLRVLWPTVKGGQGITPTNDIATIHSMEYLDVIKYGLLFSGRAQMVPHRRGTIEPYTDKEIASFPPKAARFFDKEKQAQFLNKMSADVDKFRSLANQQIPSDQYDKYRFNPLVRYPIIRIARKHGDARFYVPCIRLLYGRTTEGLYYDLSDYYQTHCEDTQKFRSAFGYVFQEYVGHLMKKALHPDQVLEEWQYHRNGKLVDTPDWIYIEGNRAVIVEVKQSALFLETKKFGDLANLRADLQKNVGKAVKQLNQFDLDMKSPGEALATLASVTEERARPSLRRIQSFRTARKCPKIKGFGAERW